MVTIRWAQGRMNEVAESVRIHGEQHPLIARWRNAFLGRRDRVPTLPREKR